MDTAKCSVTPMSVGVESSCEDERRARRESSGSSAGAGDYASARALFASLGDEAGVAQCDDAHARTLLAEGRVEEAESLARSAARTAEACEGKALLAECLTTLALAEARAGRHTDARRTFLRAVETAEAAGDRDCAGRAALALSEELSEASGAAEMCEAFERAYGLLAGTRDPETLSRLNECALRAVGAARRERVPSPKPDAASTPEEKWADFSLKAEVLRYEAELIESALRDAGGGVSYAARLLGFRHHQTFVALLNNRHKNLLHARTPVVPRRRTASRAHRGAPSR
jgi:tetratricopeptide (TPR) repeat protein